MGLDGAFWLIKRSEEAPAAPPPAPCTRPWPGQLKPNPLVLAKLSPYDPFISSFPVKNGTKMGRAHAFQLIKRSEEVPDGAAPGASAAQGGARRPIGKSGHARSSSQPASV